MGKCVIVSPGAEALRELFGGEPMLIMLDEVSVCLRKVERVYPGASDPFTMYRLKCDFSWRRFRASKAGNAINRTRFP